jgi:hypothetical protein
MKRIRRRKRRKKTREVGNIRKDFREITEEEVERERER